MINARLVLLALSPLLLLGATCVTSVEQRGPEGPWVGEVVNTGPDPVNNVQVEAEILDAAGNQVNWLAASTCPSSLLPGERGTFELFLPTYAGRQLMLPLRAVVHPIPWSSTGPGLPSEGLSVRVLEKDTARRYVLAKVRNDSAHTYREVSVCGNLRTPAGGLAEVGSAVPFPPVLRPGETRIFPMFFNSMPPGDFEFFAQANRYCCGAEIVIDPALFRISATRIIDGPDGRQVRVVGEMDNPTGQDLSGVVLQAYVAGSPAARVEAPVGCGSNIGFASTGPATFALSLERGADPSVVIAGIMGFGGWQDFYAIPVSKVSMHGVAGSQSTRVSATLTNPTVDWIGVGGICLNLRDKDGDLVGTNSIGIFSTSQSGLIEPGGSMVISGEVEGLERAESAEVIAYGQASTEPLPIVPVPVNPP